MRKRWSLRERFRYGTRWPWPGMRKRVEYFGGPENVRQAWSMAILAGTAVAIVLLLGVTAYEVYIESPWPHPSEWRSVWVP